MLLSINQLNVAHIGVLSLQLQKGEACFIQGDSGSGKTLFLRAIADIDSAKGNISLNSINRNSIPAPEWRKQVTLLPAMPQWWEQTVGEHFQQDSSELLEQLALRKQILQQPIGNLSSGENQRLALIRLLLLQPKVLLLDEPTANLDANNTRRIEQVLMKYQKTSQAGIIWVSHDKDQSTRLADRCLLLKNGALIDISSKRTK